MVHKKVINVIGLGYIGLPTALMFAGSGIKVVGTDINQSIIKSLEDGELPFQENGLEELLNSARRNGIKFNTDAINAPFYIVAVPTPFDKKSKVVDAQYVENVVKGILEICEDGAVIIIESTIAPGTIDEYIRPIVEESGKKVHLAHAPERILPGQMLAELRDNSRTIGVDDEAIGNMIRELYQSFCRGEIIVTDIKTAEMTKVVENTYRDINIAFANELADICRGDGMDVYEVIRIANKHPRVSILDPGPGVGGHCIAVDPWFLVGRYHEKAKLIHAARDINESVPMKVAARIEDIMYNNGIDSYEKIGLYGLTYKENINDIRESPTIQLISVLENKGISGYKVYDPYVKTMIYQNQMQDLNAFISACELIVIMVGHNEIKNNIFALDGKVVLDTRNIIYNMEKSYRL